MSRANSKGIVRCEDTPEQLASMRLFGDSGFIPGCPDIDHPDPSNLHGPRVSWNELVRQFSMGRVVPNRLYGAEINHEGDAI